jgi:hypothetical protein
MKNTGGFLCYYGNFYVQYDNGFVLINLTQKIYYFLFKIDDINLGS